MRVVGFDPGIAAPGVACVHRADGAIRLLDAVRVATEARDPLAKRIDRIWNALERMVREHSPDLIGIEEQAGAQVGAYQRGEFRSDNSKTMITVGIAIGCAKAYGVPWIGVTPQRAKMAVACGRDADKEQVKRAVAALCRVELRELTQAGADAAAIAIEAGRAWRPGIGRVA